MFDYICTQFGSIITRNLPKTPFKLHKNTSHIFHNGCMALTSLWFPALCKTCAIVQWWENSKWFFFPILIYELNIYLFFKKRRRWLFLERDISLNTICCMIKTVRGHPKMATFWRVYKHYTFSDPLPPPHKIYSPTFTGSKTRVSLSTFIVQQQQISRLWSLLCDKWYISLCIMIYRLQLILYIF